MKQENRNHHRIRRGRRWGVVRRHPAGRRRRRSRGRGSGRADQRRRSRSAPAAAALAETGEGRVTETEVGDEESYYEVEVTLDDGSQVDVQLDEQFNVVGSSVDHEEDGDDG